MLVFRVKQSYCPRFISCSAARNSSQLAAKNSLKYSPELTLLHKTIALLPHVLLPGAQAKNPVDSSDFWNNLLLRTHNQVSSDSIREIDITVYGTDKHSGAIDLVTALLENPLSSSPVLTGQIRTRWKKYSGQHTISLSSLPSPLASINNLDSSFLKQLSVPLRITEHLPSESPQPSRSFLNERISYSLLSADIAIIVCNPITTPLATLRHQPLLFRNPNTILVITAATSTPKLDSLIQLALPPSREASSQPHVLFVDPYRAMAANEAIAPDFRSPSVLQRYQDDYIGSRVSTVIDTLKHIIPEGKTSSLASQIPLARIREALSTCQASVEDARVELDSILSDVDALRKRVEEAKQSILQALNGSPDQNTINPPAENTLALDALQKSGKDVKATMDRLTLWKMMWRVDEISQTVSQAVEQAWCRDLERQLILQTGRLTVLQEDITRSTFTLLKAYTSPPFDSTVLRNELRQLTVSPAFSIVPDTMTLPINSRRNQIIKYPTTQLHVSGQQTLLGTSASIVAGAGVSWAGWLGWLTGTGNGLLDVIGLDAGTAIGAGLLVVAVSLRWAVAKWERSKRRWWEDWNRVGEGLGRDLKTTIDEVMHEKVFIVAESGCTRLTELALQRRKEIQEIQEYLDELFSDLDTLEQRFA